MIRRLVRWFLLLRYDRPGTKWLLCFSPVERPEPGAFQILGEAVGTHAQALQACQDAICEQAMLREEVLVGDYWVVPKRAHGDLVQLYTGTEVAKA